MIKFLTVGALVLVSLMLVPSTQAQDNTSVVGKSSNTGKAPAGAWKRECEGAAGTPQETCYIAQVVKSNGRVVFTAQFGYSGSKQVSTAIFTAPLNVLLVPGLAVKVDEGEQVTVPFSLCAQSGCRAIFNISDEVMQQLLSGSMVRIGWKTASGKDVVVPVNLTGFTAAWKTLAPKN